MPEQIQDCIDYNFINGSELLKVKKRVNNEIVTEMKKLRKYFIVYFVSFLCIPTIYLLAGVIACTVVLWDKFDTNCFEEFYQFMKYYFVFN